MLAAAAATSGVVLIPSHKNRALDHRIRQIGDKNGHALFSFGFHKPLSMSQRLNKYIKTVITHGTRRDQRWNRRFRGGIGIDIVRRQ